MQFRVLNAWVNESVRFRRRVGGAARHWLECGRGGDVEYGATATVDHRRDERTAQRGDGLDVDADHADLTLGVEFDELADRAVAGVVDQHIGGETEVGETLGYAGAFGWVAHVAAERFDAYAVLAGQRGRQAFETVDAARAERGRGHVWRVREQSRRRYRMTHR